MLPNMVGKCLPDTSAHRTHDHHRLQYPQSELKTFILTFRCIYNTSKSFTRLSQWVLERTSRAKMILAVIPISQMNTKSSTYGILSMGDTSSEYTI